MTTGQDDIGGRELAISAGLMAESDAGVLTYAGQAHAILVTQHTLVVIEVCVTLGGCEKCEKVCYGWENLTKDWQICPQESLNLHGIRQPPVNV